MKYLRQFTVIILISLIGELLGRIIPLPVPGSIYGLVIMLVCLMTKLIKPDDVKETGYFLIEIMPVMFIPAGVGIMSSWNMLKPVIIPYVVITVVTTAAVMAAAGHTAQGVIRLSGKRRSK